MDVMLNNILINFLPVLFIIILSLKNTTYTLVEILTPFILGMFIVLPASIAQNVLSPLLSQFTNKAPLFVKTGIDAYMITALIEESLKFLLIYLFIKRDIKKSHFFWVLPLLAGLGYGVCENIFHSHQTWQLILIRYVTAVPLHITTALFYGTILFLNEHRIKTPGSIKTTHIFIINIIFHGTYNIFQSFFSLFTLLFIPATVFLLIRFKIFYRKNIQQACRNRIDLNFFDK